MERITAHPAPTRRSGPAAFCSSTSLWEMSGGVRRNIPEADEQNKPA